jgi:anti-sigma factor RsiW
MSDDCAGVNTLLLRAAEGAIAPEDEARLNAHLASCPSCREALADQRAMRELLQAYPTEGARLGFDARVMAAIRAETGASASGWLGALDFRRWTWRLVPIAAALVLASLMVNRTETTEQPTLEDTVVSTSNGTDSLPVSSAWFSESVSESSLLSLMLTANVDDTLSTYRKDQ